MIIREWRCRARQSEAAKYTDYFRSEVIPELRKVQGFAGGFLTQRESGEYVEYLVLTRWKSMDAIRAFAGAVPENAVIDPRAMAIVAAYDDKVRHYDVLEELSPREMEL
jgi:heme-degrading monooxygenase HmoA